MSKKTAPMIEALGEAMAAHAAKVDAIADMTYERQMKPIGLISPERLLELQVSEDEDREKRALYCRDLNDFISVMAPAWGFNCLRAERHHYDEQYQIYVHRYQSRCESRDEYDQKTAFLYITMSEYYKKMAWGEEPETALRSFAEEIDGRVRDPELIYEAKLIILECLRLMFGKIIGEQIDKYPWLLEGQGG
jgi:hypothetical protein